MKAHNNFPHHRDEVEPHTRDVLGAEIMANRADEDRTLGGRHFWVSKFSAVQRKTASLSKEVSLLAAAD